MATTSRGQRAMAAVSLAYTEGEFNKMEDRDGHRQGLAHSRVTGSHPNSKTMRRFGRNPLFTIVGNPKQR